MSVVYKETNDKLGVSATIRKSQSAYVLSVTDTDAGKLVGTKWFSTLPAAIRYAKACLEGK